MCKQEFYNVPAIFVGNIGWRITPACAGKRIARLCAIVLNGDYPRVCGENYNDSVSKWNYYGLPPRMRGKHELLRDISAGRRITPAYAGKTVLSMDSRAVSRDHPRVCGEN